MNKRVFSTELAYALGIIILAIGTALMTLADFGLSMVVAPAYLLHLKVSETLPFFTFGMAEYMLQAVLLVLMSLLLRRFKLSYLFSFCTAVLCSVAISLFFHTYISPEAYELFVKEVSEKYKLDIHRFKTGYDCVSCLISVILSFAFYGLWQFRSVGIGTVITSAVNGKLIGFCTHTLEKHFEFRDAFPLRRYFEK